MKNKIIIQAKKGFTLIELLVVVVIIGILIAVFAPLLSGSSDGAKASALLRTADGAQKTLQQLNQYCSTSLGVPGNTLPDTGKTLSDVLFGGPVNVAPAYVTTTTCYAKSQVKPMSDLGVPTGTAGVYSVEGFDVSFAGGAGAPLQTIFANVPDSLALELASRYSPSLVVLAASDASSPVIQYSAATGGLRSVTILK